MSSPKPEGFAAGVRGLDGCWRFHRPVTVARWEAWRLAHPGWHAPLRTALEAGIACGAPAALAVALAGGLPAQSTPPGHAGGAASTESVRGGTLPLLIPLPPGVAQTAAPFRWARTVGGTYSDASNREVRRTTLGAALGAGGAYAGGGRAYAVEERHPVPVPEPGSLALLAVGALLALWARRC